MKPAATHRPIRTCIVCRQAAPQAELVRVGMAQADLGLGTPRTGRSAYAHAAGCVDRLSPPALSRALRQAVSPAAVRQLLNYRGARLA